MKIRVYLCLALLAFVCSENKSFGQGITVKNSIVIINNKSPEKENYFKEAIYKANMEGYRLKETNDTLKFKEGFDCVLISARELSNKGIAIVTDSYQEHFVYNYRKPEFSITEDGQLVATFIKISK